MCPQKYYSIPNSKNGEFILNNTENDAFEEVIEADMKNNNEKL